MPEVINCCFFFMPLLYPSQLLCKSLSHCLAFGVRHWGAPRMLGREQLKALLGNMQFYLDCNLTVLFESMLFVWKLLLWLERTFPGADSSCEHAVIIFIITFIFITCTYREAHSPCTCHGADSSLDESCQYFQLKWLRASSVLKLYLYRGARRMASFLLA